MPFKKTFEADHKFSVTGFFALYFTSPFTKEKIVEQLLEKDGVNKFVTPEKGESMYSSSTYKDGRINSLQVANGGQCCAFSKNKTMHYIYAIPDSILKNVGLDVDDLLYWINFLIEARLGLDYRYLGVQKVPQYIQGCDYGDVHFVYVPAFPKDVSSMRSYFHWLLLRFLFCTYNGVNSSTAISQYYNKTGSSNGIKPYYMIPRIAKMFHEEFGLSRWKAIKYAHMADQFSGYYALFLSELTPEWGSPTNTSYVNGVLKHGPFSNRERFPDLSVTNREFQYIMQNSMVTSFNLLATELGQKNAREYVKKYMSSDSSYTEKQKEDAERTLRRDMKAPYDRKTMIDLFNKGNYQGYIDYIESCYKESSNKTENKTEVKNERKSTRRKAATTN